MGTNRYWIYHVYPNDEAVNSGLKEYPSHTQMDEVVLWAYQEEVGGRHEYTHGLIFV